MSERKEKEKKAHVYMKVTVHISKPYYIVMSERKEKEKKAHV